MLHRLIALLTVLLALASTSLSQTLTMIHEGRSAGRLAGVSFVQSSFTITCTANLSDRQSSPVFPGFWIDHSAVTIDIAGVGSVDITVPTRTFVNSQSETVGFSRAGVNGLDLFNGPDDPSFMSWNMLVPIGPLSGTGTTLQWDSGDILTSGGALDFFDNFGQSCTFTAVLNSPNVGTPFCVALPNSTGQVGSIVGQGSNVASQNDLTLTASELPQDSFGIFLASRTQDFVTGFGGSVGNLCLGGSIGRYVGPSQIQSSGGSGSISLVLDLTEVPTPNGLVAVQVGETWNFQLWHRDLVAGQTTSNFTHGLELVFQ